MTGRILLFATLAGVANVIGALAMTSRRSWSTRSLQTVIALAAGFMLSVAIAGLLPEAVEVLGMSAGYVALVGFVLVHITQHALGQHFHYGVETHRVTPAVGVSALAGLMLHTLVDGVAIASGFQVSEELGVLVFVAIFLHKLPEGLAISSLFLAAGVGRTRALLAACALAVATIIGALATQAFTGIGAYGLALSAGVMLYVGASNLVPEFQQVRGWRFTLSFLAGCVLYFVSHLLVE